MKKGRSLENYLKPKESSEIWNCLVTSKSKRCIRDESMEYPIKTSESDPAFFEEVNEETGAEKVLMCFNCKGRSTGCPATDVVQRCNIKNFCVFLQWGCVTVHSIVSTLYCTICFRFQEWCQEVAKTMDTVLKIRSIVVKNGFMLPAHESLKMRMLLSNWIYRHPQAGACKGRHCKSQGSGKNGWKFRISNIKEGYLLSSQRLPIQVFQGLK